MKKPFLIGSLIVLVNAIINITLELIIVKQRDKFEYNSIYSTGTDILFWLYILGIIFFISLEKVNLINRGYVLGCAGSLIVALAASPAIYLTREIKKLEIYIKTSSEKGHAILPHLYSQNVLTYLLPPFLLLAAAILLLLLKKYSAVKYYIFCLLVLLSTYTFVYIYSLLFPSFF